MELRTEIRGCESDQKQQSVECVDNPDRCVFCNTIGCNNQAAVSKPTLSCIKCSGKDRCPWGHNATDVTACTADVLFPKRESCFTAAQRDGESVTRGCTLDAEAQCAGAMSCEKCSTAGCNVENVVYSYCYQCRSFLDIRCLGSLNDMPSIYAEACADSAYAPEDRGCYTKLYEGEFQQSSIIPAFISHYQNISSYTDNILVRGCLKDLSLQERFECHDGNNTDCTVCLGNNCNSNAFTRSSAWSHPKIPAILLAFIAFFIRLFG